MYDRTVCQFLGNIQLIFVHETVVPSADINETDVQDYHQHRDIDLGDYNSLEEDDALVGDISPEGEDEEEEDDDSGDLHQHAVRATVDWNEYVQKGQKLIKYSGFFESGENPKA